MISTVNELNEIHRQWMALDSTGPVKEIDRVTKLMKNLPSVYVSGHDGMGVVMHTGSPLNRAMDFDACLELCRRNGGRTDIAWNGKIAQWYDLNPKEAK